MGIPGKQYYTIEQHGNKNEYALYFGRDGGRHGLNLCKLSDFDYNGAETRQKIVNALNDTDIKKEDVMDKHWCMCIKLKAVLRDMWSTCSICGGKDAYGTSKDRPINKRKNISPYYL